MHPIQADIVPIDARLAGISALITVGYNRDRGQSCDCTPPTPPDIRVRIRRFAGLSGPQLGDEGKAE
jgi:hypothetical protein